MIKEASRLKKNVQKIYSDVLDKTDDSNMFALGSLYTTPTYWGTSYREDLRGVDRDIVFLGQ